MAQFTRGELEVMEVLWKHKWLKPSEIQEHFGRPIRNAALRSVLLILLEQEHVVRERRGKAYYYKAATSMAPTVRAMARRLAQVFCGGSSAALIAQLIETENLSAEDLKELRKIAQAKIGKQKSNKGGQGT